MTPVKRAAARPETARKFSSGADAGSSAWRRWGLAIIVWVGLTMAAAAQDYRDVAPRTQPGGPAPTITLPPAPAPSDDQRRIVPTLKALVFVNGIERVERTGIVANGVNPTNLPLLNTPDFLAAMQAYLGQPLTFARLNEITRAVVAQYRKEDRPLVDVVVPQQDVNNGAVQVAVIEFRVGTIRTEGNKWFSDSVLEAPIRVGPGDTVVGSALVDDITTLNENPFRHVDLVYERSAEVGRSDIVLHTQDRLPLRLYTGVDDTGTRALGINHVFAGFNWGNVFGLDHQLSYQATASDDLLYGNPDIPGRPDQPRYLAHSGTYTIPLPWHDRLSVFGLYAESVPRLPNTLEQTGISAQASFRYAIPFARSESQSHELRLGYDFKTSNNNLEFGGTQVNATTTDIHQLAVEYSGQTADHWGSTALNSSLFVSPGGLTTNNSDLAFNLSRAGAPSNYVYGQLGAERITDLPQGLSWSARGLIQRSSAPLLSSEQFQLGGPTTVRGYDQYQVEGDNGWLVVNELRSPVFRPTSDGFADRLQVLGFVDVGHISSLAAQTGQPSHATLSSVGVGLRYGIDRYLDLRFDYGWQLIRLQPIPGTNTPGAPSRGDLSLTLSY